MNLPPPPQHKTHAQKIKEGKAKKALVIAIGEEQATDDLGNKGSHIELTIRKLWNAAHGYVENTKQEDGTVKQVIHPMSINAADKMLDRTYGKPAAAEQGEQANRITAADKVDDLVKAQLNQLTDALMNMPTNA